MRLQQRCQGTTPSAAADGAVTSTACGCLRRLVSKVKKQGKLILNGGGIFIRRSTAVAPTRCCASSPSPSPALTSHFGKCNGAGASKCCYNYDPLSYSLNFDSRSLVDDEEYFYQFCAFSSRFAAPRPPTPPPPTLLLAASH